MTQSWGPNVLFYLHAICTSCASVQVSKWLAKVATGGSRQCWLRHNLSRNIALCTGIIARRRHNETLQRGENVSYQHVLREIIGRDKVDTTRTHSPLKAASDALIVETHGLDVNQVINAILGHIKEN